MIVHDLDVLGSFRGPTEANPPLTIDPYAMLPLAIPLECFQMVAGRRAQVVEPHRRVDHIEFRVATASKARQRAGQTPSRKNRSVARSAKLRIIDVVCVM